MSHGQWLFAVFDVSSEENIVDRVANVCRDTGFEVGKSSRRAPSQGRYHTVPVSFGSKSTNLLFDLQDDRDQGEPLLSFHKMVYPEDGDEDDDAIEAIFELICRLAIDLDAAYIPLFHSEKRSMAVIPDQRPIPAAVETPPRFGVYADDVLEGFGGVDGLFDHDPWYVAELDDEHTLVIESESPWGNWRPPTEAPFIRSAKFHESDPEDTPTSDDETVLSDPFAALEPGAYGTDVCIDPDDIAAEFHNEDLELVRVYVDENRNLRRARDDSFVRKVVVDGPDDNVAFVKAMLADVPTDAVQSECMVSALLNDAVPAAFVRADEPDGETVVSRVLGLDIDTNKIELLVSLGRAVRHGDEMDAETVEAALDTLTDLDDAEQIERYVETHFL